MSVWKLVQTDPNHPGEARYWPDEASPGYPDEPAATAAAADLNRVNELMGIADVRFTTVKVG